MDGLDAISETAAAAALELAVSAVAERGGTLEQCRNCNAPVLGAYCLACGQPLDMHRRSVFHLLQDFFKDLVSFDSRILRTARALLFEPGELPVAFREGRTQRYVPPVRLYFFVSLIFFVLLSTTGVAILQLELVGTTVRYVADKNHNVVMIKNGVSTPMEGFKADDKGNVFLSDEDGTRVPIRYFKADGATTNTINTEAHYFARIGAFKDKLTPASRAAIAEMLTSMSVKANVPGLAVWIENRVARTIKTLADDPAAINGPLTEWIPRVLFVLLPLFALLLAAFYWRQRKQFYFVDHLVFSLNVHSFMFVVLLAAAALVQFVPDYVAGLAVLGCIAVYLFLAMKRFYRQSWLWTAAKFAAVISLYAIFFLGPALGGIILLSLLYM